MMRCIALSDQSFSSKLAANQSSNSGCVGRFPVEPKLLGLPAIALPKCHCQIRLAITRLVSGFFGLAIQVAKAVRLPSTASTNCGSSWDARTLRPAGWTGSDGENGSPPASTQVCSISPSLIRFRGHSHRGVDRRDLRRSPVVDSQRERTIAIKLPTQSLDSFARHTLPSKLLGCESNQLRWIVLLGNAHLIHSVTNGLEIDVAGIVLRDKRNCLEPLIRRDVHDRRTIARRWPA